MTTKEKLEKGNCPWCDETGWAGSDEMFESYRKWHEAGHPTNRSSLIVEIKEWAENNYHFWRECPSCGYAGGGYLHCLHDKIQKPCHNCGVILPSKYAKCECEFITKNNDLIDYLDKQNDKKTN